MGQYGLSIRVVNPVPFAGSALELVEPQPLATAMSRGDMSAVIRFMASILPAADESAMRD
jgi:hypothetical protein